MPRYSYLCSECSSEFSLWHSYGESGFLCPECSSENIDKIFNNKNIYSYIETNNSSIKQQKIGQITQEFIKEAAEELKEFKEQKRKDFKK